MKRNKISIAVIVAFLSFPVLAKVTMEDVNEDTAALSIGVPDQAYMQEELDYYWENFNKPPETNAGDGATVSTHSARNTTTKLKPISTHICSISRVYGYYHKGLKGINVHVYQNPTVGYWYMTAASTNSDNLGDAICWTK